MTDAASHFNTSTKTCYKAATWSGASNVAMEPIVCGLSRFQARRHPALRFGTKLPTSQVCIQGASPGVEAPEGNNNLERHQGDG